MSGIQLVLLINTKNMINKNKVGLVFAVVIGGAHIVWSLLVFLGLGQALLDFIMWVHMINISLTVGPFNLMSSAILIVVTSIIGYLIGIVVATVWEKIHR